MIALRVIRPERPAQGAYLHFHGGGWTLGAPHHDDARLETIADKNGLVAISVKYRLAPEHPYPAGPDDCESAALWLVENAPERFGTSKLTIGGESAGAHLAVVTLLRLRDRHAHQTNTTSHNTTRFTALNFLQISQFMNYHKY